MVLIIKKKIDKHDIMIPYIYIGIYIYKLIILK